jgi:phospholipase C
VAAGSIVGFPRTAGATRRRRATATTVLDNPARECPVDTVVVLMLENRSFDHMIGWLGGNEAYLEAGKQRYGTRFSINARTNLRYRDPNGHMVPTGTIYTLPGGNGFRGCGHEGPGHSWDNGRRQRDAGFLASGTGNDRFAVSYHTEKEMPISGILAKRFTVFDNYHASLLGPTFPNRQYVHSAQSEGRKQDPGPLVIGVFKAPTIWDLLQRENVSARYYFYDLPLLLLWGERMTDRVSGVDQFLDDAATGNLPNVAMVEPSFTTDLRTDDHPRGDIRAGQRYIAAIVDALARSPQWERTALFVTYDEWGGFFDHVPPPILPDSRASTNDEDNFGQAGFRVATLLVSPHARRGFVDHRVYDHTSILRFIEWRFLGAPAEGTGGSGWWLTKRDRNANNIGFALRPGKADLDPGYDTALRIRSLAKPSAVCGESEEHASLALLNDPFKVVDPRFSDRIQSDYGYPARQPWFDGIPA